MSSTTQVGQHDAGANAFTSWRSAVASMVILAVVVAVLVVDLVVPLIG